MVSSFLSRFFVLFTFFLSSDLMCWICGFVLASPCLSRHLVLFSLLFIPLFYYSSHISRSTSCVMLSALCRLWFLFSSFFFLHHFCCSPLVAFLCLFHSQFLSFTHMFGLCVGFWSQWIDLDDPTMPILCAWTRLLLVLRVPSPSLGLPDTLEGLY